MTMSTADEDFFTSTDFGDQADAFDEAAPESDFFDPSEYYDDGYTPLEEPLPPSRTLPDVDPPVPTGLVEGMNPAQEEATSALLGPLLVVAGPGSGKTRVLTHRVAALVATGLAQPWEILAVTFTNKAAAEMRERIAALVGQAASSMWISTFHSACVRILRANAELAGLPRSFSIVDTADSGRVVKSVLLDMGMPAEASDVKEARSIISRAKNDAMTAVSLAATSDAWCAPVMEGYDERLRSMGSVDFDDILLRALVLLRSEPEVRARYQRKFRFVLVDEYQDTNAVQYEITQILAAGHGNICVVGDADQSIYAFRGASPEGMTGFSARYPKARVVLLEQNYRSTKAIVEAYRSLIEPNPALHRPHLFTDNPGGDPVRVVLAGDDREEAAFVVKEAKAKPRGETTAVLMRTNSQTRSLEDELRRARVTYSVVGALRFYDRAEVKDALSYLRLAVNPADAVSFARCVNTPRRGVGDATSASVVDLARQRGLDVLGALEAGLEEGLWKGRAASGLRTFKSVMDSVGAACMLGPAAALKVVAEEGGLREALAKDKSEGPDRVNNLEELVSGAQEYLQGPSPTRPDAGLVSEQDGLEQTLGYLEGVALISSADAEDESSGPHVVLLTAHASKGKEYDHVWVVGVEDTLFPHKRVADDPVGVEEERRLLFVACSRPRKTLTLTRARTRLNYGKRVDNAPSPFLADLPPSVQVVRTSGRSNPYGAPRPGGFMPRTDQYRTQQSTRPSTGAQARPSTKPAVPKGPRVDPADLAPGTSVLHKIFGAGRVESVDGVKATILFGSTRRILDVSIAPLELA
jgi:DNA helicase-2/ATP-dependent DNA helicase PcrA